MCWLAKYPSFEEQHKKVEKSHACHAGSPMQWPRHEVIGMNALFLSKHPLSANSWLFVKCCTSAMKRNEMKETKSIV